MYVALVVIHSWLRWLVLLAGAHAVLRAATGAQSGRGWTGTDERAGKWLNILFDIQLFIGLALYVVFSPTTQRIFGDFGAAMGDSQDRFWAVEHLMGMLVASALLHIGLKKTRTAPERTRHRVALIFYGLALFIVLLSIPWPFMPAARPLFRF